MGITDSWLAYQLDLTCAGAGLRVETAQVKARASGKAMPSAADVLSGKGQATQFTSFRSRGITPRKVQIREDGGWDD